MKSAKRSIIEGALWQSLSRILSRGLSFVIFIIVANHLSLAVYGNLQLLFSIITPAAVFLTLGLNQLIKSDIAVCRGKNDFAQTHHIIKVFFNTHV